MNLLISLLFATLLAQQAHPSLSRRRPKARTSERRPHRRDT